jgi:protein-S-isoprenylcysteine O-methyltransferase Ste14
VETSAQLPLEERFRRAVTWWRVPLMVIGVLGLTGFLHSKHAFWIGAPVSILGELIQMWAGSHLHKDERLTISGPYSHVRNPMYIGRFVLGLGFFIMTWNPYLIGGYVVLFAAYAHARVKREEGRLREIFAPKYQEWCDETHRWLPSLRAYSGSESRRASWTQVCLNHENINTIGLLIVLAVVYLRIDRLPDLFWRIGH